MSTDITVFLFPCCFLLKIMTKNITFSINPTGVVSVPLLLCGLKSMKSIFDTQVTCGFDKPEGLDFQFLEKSRGERNEIYSILFCAILLSAGPNVSKCNRDLTLGKQTIASSTNFVIQLVVETTDFTTLWVFREFSRFVFNHCHRFYVTYNVIHM